MTTLVNLQERCELALNDATNATWGAETLQQWILDAIRDYSQYFPRLQTATTTISTASPGHSFDLPTDFLSVLLVEFPTGEDPPEYLTRRSRTHPQFYDYEGYYDVEASHDATGTGTLYLSEEPSNGESFVLTYHATHATDLDDTDTITVREDHEEILILFVVWTAFKERAATEQQDPDTTIHLLQQIVKAAEQAEAEYRRALRRAESHRADGGWAGSWTADVYDPIY
jgi:hypothetical protein